MRKLSLFIVFVLTTASVFAQESVTINGLIRDKTGKPIANATIVTETDSIAAKTGYSGNFTLTLDGGNQRLMFSAKGFLTEEKYFDVNKNSPELAITLLRENVKEIAEVFLSADRKLQVNRLNIKNIENPMTVNVLSRDMLEQLDVNNIEDAVRHIPGVNSINTYGGFQFFNIRGFENFVVLYDGIRDERHNITQSAPVANFANVERIEVLKGPSGDMFGHSALGAILNIIRKKPTATQQGNARFTIGSYKAFGATIGIGGPVNDKLRYRFDFGTSNTDGWKGVEEKTNNMSAIIEYLPTSKDIFELMFQYNKDHYGGDTGVPANSNGKPYSWLDPKTNFSDPNDYIKNDKKEYSFRYTHKFSTSTVLRNVLSYFDDTIDYLEDEVIFTNEVAQTFSRFNGASHFQHNTKPVVNQTDLTFKFDTGKITHRSIVGGSYTYLDRTSYYGEVTTKHLAKDIDIHTLAGNANSRTLTNLKDETVTLRENIVGIYFQDWVSFTNRFKALIGLRYDFFSGKYNNPRADKDHPRKEDKFENFTYRGALTYEPIKNFMTVYGSASKFFKPSRTHSISKNNEMFKPEKGYQIETGIKFEKKNVLNLTLSGYYIEKNHFTVGHSVQSQVGTAISRGLEIDGDVKLFDGMYLRAGYSYTDAFFAEQDNPDLAYINHNVTPWTPKHMLNTWLNYELSGDLKGLGLGLGVYHTSKIYQTEKNNQYLPSYTLINAAIYYKTKNNIRIGVNIENLADTTYYNGALTENDLYGDSFATSTGIHQQSTLQVYPGRGRNYKLSLSYEF